MNYSNKNRKLNAGSKKVLGADEFFNGKERWCLWLVEASVADLESMPLVGKRVLAVKKCPS
ncbi:type IIL restriction-modification enzyme MmeI [Dickeya ananatis]